MSRGILIVLLVALAATALIVVASYPYTIAGHQERNMAIAAEQLPRVNKLLEDDERFHSVKAYVYTGQNGAVGLTGTVASDDELCRLMKQVGEQRLPVAVSWQVRIVEP